MIEIFVQVSWVYRTIFKTGFLYDLDFMTQGETKTIIYRQSQGFLVSFPNGTQTISCNALSYV